MVYWRVSRVAGKLVRVRYKLSRVQKIGKINNRTFVLQKCTTSTFSATITIANPKRMIKFENFFLLIVYKEFHDGTGKRGKEPSLQEKQN